MAKWIRWWGLGAFMVVAVLAGCVWVFLVDGWVEGMIEDAGTAAVGAKVELDGADLSRFPAGLTLTRLQITNPRKPLTNVVEVARVAMGLDGLNLLRRKVIVEEMALDGVRLGTTREVSGAIHDTQPGPDSEKDAGMFSISLPSREVPDVKKILEQEDLETIRLIETLKADIKQEKEAWETRLKELPGKAQLAEYKERVKNLKKAAKGGLEGVLGGVGEVQTLKQDIEQEIQSLKDARKEFEEKVALLRTRLEQVKTAPKRDIQRLKAKYNLSPQGLANMSQSLLGDEIGSMVRQGVEWYERAKPFLEGAQALQGGESGPEVKKPLRGKGVDVHFHEENPLPEFLIKVTKASVRIDVGDLSGIVHNITNDQPTLGQPMTFTFSGEQLKGVQSVTLEGALNHVVPALSHDRLSAQAKGYQIAEVVLSKDKSWPVTLTSGLADVKVKAEVKGPQLRAQGVAGLQNLDISAGTPGDTNPLTASLSSAVQDISQVSLEANLKGTLDHYDMALSSDLDRILQNAAGKMVNDLAAKFGADLQTAISAKIAEQIGRASCRERV